MLRPLCRALPIGVALRVAALAAAVSRSSTIHLLPHRPPQSSLLHRSFSANNGPNYHASKSSPEELAAAKAAKDDAAAAAAAASPQPDSQTAYPEPDSKGRLEPAWVVPENIPDWWVRKSIIDSAGGTVTLPIRLLDVKAFTQTMISTSKSEEMAKNAISWGPNDDGSEFVGKKLGEHDSDHALFKPHAQLSFKIHSEGLSDGALFLPQRMEHKWALFYQKGQILVVRSWSRKLCLTADTEISADGKLLTVTSIRGSLTDAPESTSFTSRSLDYLLRSHSSISDTVYPVPLPTNHGSIDEFAPFAPMWCFSLYGCNANYATFDEMDRQIPYGRGIHTMRFAHPTPESAQTTKQ